MGQNKMAPASLETSRALCQQARAHMQKGNLDEAEACLRRALATADTAEAHHYTGVVHYLRGDRAGAVAALQAALAVDPGYARSLANLAALAVEAGDHRTSMQYIALAIKADPSNIEYKNSFVSIIYQANILLFSPQLKELVGLCLETDDLYHSHLFVTWYSLLKSDPDFRPVYKLFSQGEYKSFLKHIRKLPNPKALLDPFFIGGLKRLTLVDRHCERFLTHLRRFLLDSARETPDVWHTPDFDALWCALAQYCFHTEYIFNFTGEEQKQTEDLQTAIEALPDSEIAASRHAVFALACYMPLASLKNAESVAKALAAASAPLRELAKIQIDEPLEERRIRKTITALTPINDEMSRAVQGQYEVFPYPRWKSMSAVQSHDDAIGGLKDNSDILVAGCGTGQEAIINAAAFPNARVLAIDLSLSSLSYAIRKAREMNLTNITFGQADLLELKRLGRTFDLISSTGVLTCVSDPPAAWAGLIKLLKPGGLMRTGLYSRPARRVLTETQKLIVSRKYSFDAEGMRQFRKEAHGILKKDTLMRIEGMRDFYSLSECRDLLFHVLEICHDIPEIEDLLQKLGLQFIKFNVSDKTVQKYLRKFPDDPPGGSLRHWHEFEQENPDTFIEMYNFWSRKLS